jgi:hypothetical protein
MRGSQETDFVEKLPGISLILNMGMTYLDWVSLASDEFPAPID